MGGSGSGTLIGHAIPGTLFILFGTFFLLLTLTRYRDFMATTTNTSRNTSNEGNGATNININTSIQFCDSHLPEQNLNLLRQLGGFLMILATIGVLIEAGGALHDGLNFFFQLAHQALYLCFFFVGLVAALEGRQLVGPDASRVALSLAFGLQYVLWNEHGIMKTDMGDKRVHLLMAQINAAVAIAFAYSVYNPTSMLGLVSGWALMVLNGVWMMTAGVTACCIEITMHVVGAVLVLETLAVGFVVVLTVACFCPSSSSSTTRTNLVGQYRSIEKSEEDEEEELTAGSSSPSSSSCQDPF